MRTNCTRQTISSSIERLIVLLVRVFASGRFARQNKTVDETAVDGPMVAPLLSRYGSDHVTAGEYGHCYFLPLVNESKLRAGFSQIPFFARRNAE
jgi:hypothetical protein